MRVLKNPSANTRATVWTSADKVPQGVQTEEMSEAQFAEWLAAQPSLPEPQSPVPTNLPAWRIRVVLKQRGLLNNVKQLIAALPQSARDIAEEQLIDSKFERHHPLIDQLGAALGLTSDDLDDIFSEADALV